jgi:uncharacterized protein
VNAPDFCRPLPTFDAACRFSFVGHEFVALPDGALFWPARSALIVADLHFEKASAFARHGQFLPPYDSAATLARLAESIVATKASELWCLGDSFHDGGGPLRLDPASRAALIALTGQLDWTWITGNHDGTSAAILGGAVREEALVDGLRLRHEAQASETGPELSGHYHPKCRVKARGRAVSRRCFLRTGHRLILPAYGSLTGGLDVRSPVFAGLAGGDGEALVPLAGRLLRFPLA